MQIIKKFISLIDKFWNTLILRKKHVIKGNRLRIRGKIFIHGDGNITFGDDVNIISTPYINPIGGNSHAYFQADRGGKINIGSRVGMTAPAITAYSSVIIEDDVLLGRSVSIYDTDFHSLDFISRSAKVDTNIKTLPVKLCKGVFIGAHTIILKGVTIGEMSVVGAGSVVTGNVPPGEVWAGNPARFIKKL